MEIEIVSATGTGTTEVGAVDSALKEAGLHNYNLVEPSSTVIPAVADVKSVSSIDEDWPTGAVVAAALAEESTSGYGTAAAGIAWQEAEEGGVFVSQGATTQKECRDLLDAQLADFRENRPDWCWTGSQGAEIEVVKADDTAAAIAAAVYRPIQLR